MLAILIGALALAFGLLLMLLPLMASQLARPRDGLWAAVVLLLGLVLVTGAERLTGGPMLGVLCGGLLIGRLSTEVGQQRWAVLDQSARDELQQRSYWQGQLIQLKDALQKLLTALLGLLGWIKDRLRKPAITKKWVRADAEPSSERTAPEEGTGEVADDLITEQPSEEAASTAEPEPIELTAHGLETEAQPQQHNNPEAHGDSSNATSVEVVVENFEQHESSADQEQEQTTTAEVDAGEAADDLITEQPSEEAESTEEPEPIELMAHGLETQAESKQHNTPAAHSASSNAISVEVAVENLEQQQPSADQEQEQTTTALEDTLPVVEADILDPEPLPSRPGSSAAVSLIESLDEVDELIADGQN